MDDNVPKPASRAQTRAHATLDAGIDALDARILAALDDDASATILQLARTLGVSRNTVHARMRRMERAAIFGGFSQRVSPATLGYPLVAFLSLSVSQSEGAGAAAALAQVPEVVEIHATTGDADFLVKAVARDAQDLYRLTNLVLTIPGVVRSNTVVSLSEVMANRTRRLIDRAAEGAGAGLTHTGARVR